MKLPSFVSPRSRRWGKRWRWQVTRALGVDRYTWAALHGLDRRLAELVGHRRGGTFVELGGNDGLQQSNTLALEQLLGWRGLLVEADPELAAECRRNRPAATVICAGAGPGWGLGRLARADLMSQMVARPADEPSTIVPIAPLSELIDAAGLAPEIDLLSLDVEGHELAVLEGLDLARHRPRHLLVETEDRDAVAAILGPGYEWDAQWSYHDHLFTRRTPGP